MKPLLIIIISILLINSAKAQLLPGGKKDKYETVRKKKSNGNVRYYTGIGLRGIHAMDDWGVELSIKFGGLVTKNIALGLTYNSLFSKNLDIPELNGQILRMQSFALQPEYLFWLNQYFLLSIYANAGFAYVSTSGAGNIDFIDDLNGDWAFQSEQGFTFNYRMMQSLWLSLEAGYRSTIGINYNAFGDKEISGMTFGVTLKAFLF